MAVFDEFLGDVFLVEASVFGKDPISDDPRDDGEIDDAEFLSKEIWATDLVGVALKVFDPLVQDGYLKFGGAGVEEAEVARHDELVNEIGPDPGLSGLVWIGWSQMGFRLGVNILEELENNMGVVEGISPIGESGDQPFGIESCGKGRREMSVRERVRAPGDHSDVGWGRLGRGKQNESLPGSLTQEGRVLIERICLDIFVRNPTFFEGNPTFVGEWTKLLIEGGEGGR